MLFLTVSDILESHQGQIEIYGGSPVSGIVDCSNQRLLNHRQPLAVSNCMQTSLRWQRPTCITS